MSNYQTEDLTGKIDPATGSLIIADRIMHGPSSFDLTLPSVECSNCTLQLTQMMTDKPPYTADITSDDIYYQCVDLVLTSSAPPPDAGTGAGDGTAGTSGGCSTSGGVPGLLVVAALGLLHRRRSRDRVGRARSGQRTNLLVSRRGLDMSSPRRCVSSACCAGPRMARRTPHRWGRSRPRARKLEAASVDRAA